MIIPQFNYILHLLPISLPPALLKKFNAAVDFFLWEGKRPRLNKLKMSAANEDGGLNLPRLDWYHLAFSLNQLAKIDNAENQAPGWVLIEKELTEPVPLQALRSQTGGEIPSRNPLLSFVRETWQRSHDIAGLNPFFTKQSPLWHNKKLKVGKNTLFWKSWVVAGIIYVRDIFENDSLVSFQQLATKYKLPKQDF